MSWLLGLLASAELVWCRRALPPQLQLRFCCLLRSSSSRGIGWSEADYGAAALLRGLAQLVELLKEIAIHLAAIRAQMDKGILGLLG
jgi:hypothetical protein